jgi:hypothetical protein
MCDVIIERVYCEQLILGLSILWQCLTTVSRGGHRNSGNVKAEGVL